MGADGQGRRSYIPHRPPNSRHSIQCGFPLSVNVTVPVALVKEGN